MIIEKYQKFKNRLNLKPRYLRIFEFRQGINDTKPHTLKESGERFGISPGRIRQIVTRVLYELEKLAKY